MSDANGIRLNRLPVAPAGARCGGMVQWCGKCGSRWRMGDVVGLEAHPKWKHPLDHGHRLHCRLIRPQAKCRFEPTKDVANSLVSREEDIQRIWSYSTL